MPNIEIRGEKLHYERDGTGPTLAMFHSLGTNSYLWQEQFAAWRSQFTCISFDARGHGRSTNNGGVTMQTVAEDVHTALNELGLLPAHLIGISMGGLQCARFHALAVDSVLSIVYADSFASLGDAGPARISAMEKKIGAMSMEEFGADYAADTLLPDTPKERHDALIAAISGMTKDNYMQTVRSIFTVDVREQLKVIEKPMHIVTGELDQRTPLSAAEAVHDLVHGSTMQIIPDAGHLSNIDNPTGFHAAVEPFLERWR
jgi:3-oxoadipate enol-lactonase